MNVTRGKLGPMGAVLFLPALLSGCTGIAEPGSGLTATIVVGVATLVIVAFLVRFEAASINARELAIIALLGTLAALLRVPFAAVPNLQPSTYLVICTGYVFGPLAGFVVGTLTAVVSNFFLGHGPWTLFQALAWGLAGASAVVLRAVPLKTVWLVLAGVVWGILFGLIMNVWTWVAFVYPLTARSFMVTWAASIPFDVMHAVGNALFLGFLGVRTIHILSRYHRRFYWVRRKSEDDSESDI